MTRTLAESFAARLAADVAVAGAAEALDGGATQLRSARFPVSRDLNALWLAPGARPPAVAAAVARAPRRVIAPAPAGPVAAEGWRTDEQLVLLHDGSAPEAPPVVVEALDPLALHPARLGVWGTLDAGHAEELAAMQLAISRSAGARSLAVLEDGDPAAWCVVVGGCVDDVWVQPARRGQGLGRAILRAAVAGGGWYLWSDADNAAALALYGSEGFAVAGRVALLTPR